LLISRLLSCRSICRSNRLEERSTRQTQARANANAPGIACDGSLSSTLLQNRASSSDEWARQVLQVFTQIGTNLKAARREVRATSGNTKARLTEPGFLFDAY
jgi:hypothetical protein